MGKMYCSQKRDFCLSACLSLVLVHPGMKCEFKCLEVILNFFKGQCFPYAAEEKCERKSEPSVPSLHFTISTKVKMLLKMEV